MTAPTDAEKALAVARFCWPRRQWGVSKKGEVGTLPDPGPDVQFDTSRYDEHFPGQMLVLYGIRSAEESVSERGLAEEYGCALLEELLPRRKEWSGDETAWLCATAPLEARMNALFRVATTTRGKAS